MNSEGWYDRVVVINYDPNGYDGYDYDEVVVIDGL